MGLAPQCVLLRLKPCISHWRRGSCLRRYWDGQERCKVLVFHGVVALYVLNMLALWLFRPLICPSR
jgi:hypothetical protein